MGFLRCDGRLMGRAHHGTLTGDWGSAREWLLPFVAPIERVPEDRGRVAGAPHVRLRRRGPGEDSTGRAPVARRICDTPGEYGSTTPRRPAGAGSPESLPRFDTPRACV